jgi:hypothetical protein
MLVGSGVALSHLLQEHVRQAPDPPAHDSSSPCVEQACTAVFTAAHDSLIQRPEAAPIHTAFVDPDHSAERIADTGPAASSTARIRRMRGTAVLLGLILLISTGTTALAMRHTSSTFDEIILAAAGARGYETGDFDLVIYYHPRLMPLLYGIPLHLSGVEHPPDNGQWKGRGVAFPYGQTLFFAQETNAEVLVFRVRLVAVAIAAMLVLLTFVFVRRYYGDVPALFAAALVAFLPDVLGHGGIAYNDIPNAAASLGAVWCLDRAARRPSWQTALLAGAVTGAALNVKYSAVALAPIALLLVLLEAATRGPAWRPYVTRAALAGAAILVTVYAVTVALYLGDITLTSFRAGLEFNIVHASGGHGVPAWLMGQSSMDGFPWYFAAAFFIKTPAAFHALLLLGLAGLLAARGERRGWRELLGTHLRAPVVAIVVYALFLASAGLNIGFRHAHAILPFVCIVAAAGLWRLWQQGGTRLRGALVGLVVLHAVSVLSWYPHFIPYTSEYFADRDGGHMLLVDSSLDWGQGLIALRDFMEEEHIPVVHLSYFGSAWPSAYGVRYVPLRSFFPLPHTTPPETEPQYVAVSATNLVGPYVDDVFARFRDIEPYRVLAHSIFIYRLTD